MRFLLVIPALMLACLPPVQTRAERILLKAAKAYGVEGESLEPAHLLIVDGKIAGLGSDLEASEATRTIELEDAVLLPGLVNAYSQAGVSGGDSEFTREVTPNYELHSAVDWDALAFRIARAEGVTTIAIAPGTDNVFAGVAFAVKAGGAAAQRVIDEDLGLVVTVASDPRSRNRARSRPDSIFVRQPTNRMGVVWMMRSTLDRTRQGLGPEYPRVAEVLSGKRQAYCVSRTHIDIEAALNISKEFSFSPILIGGQEAYMVAEQLAERKIPVILEPLQINSPYGVEGTEPAWNGAGILDRAGIEIALCGPRLLEQARFAIRFGLSPDVALNAITRTPAKLLGLEDQVGTLAVGRAADITVLSGEPFEFTTNVQAVMIGGKLYEQEK